MLPVDGGALGDREVRLEAFELPDRLSAIPGCQQVQHPGADWPGLEHAAIEQHGGWHQCRPAGPRSDQRAEFVARLHILQAAREEAGQMLADHRIACVGQAEFLQSGPPCLARQVVESGPGEEPVGDDLRQRGAIERRGNCLGKQAGAARGRKLAEQNVVQVQSAFDPPKRLALGESAVQADGVVSNLLLLKEQGAPVEPVYPTEGTPLITAPSGIFQSAPHPNAARLLQSFLSSLEAQQLLVDASGLCSFHALLKDRPIRASLPAIKLMKSDPAAVEAQREEIIIRYSKIFGAS